MATITVYSYDDLTTLERGYTSDPIDMPFSETTDRKEYVLSTDAFLREYKNWDQAANPMLAVNDELSQLEIWISEPQARRIKQAIDRKLDSVDLAQR